MILIFDSHPVQYKAPVYRALARRRPGKFKVIYCTGVSLRRHREPDFGRELAWDTPLLDGYTSAVLDNERGEPLRGFRSLTGKGVFGLLRKERPSAVLISQFLYEADLVAYLSCLFLRIPVWIRHETQDEAMVRGPLKSLLRGLFYRLAYAGVSRAFYIGRLNLEHLLRHGLFPAKLGFSPYCVLAPVAAMRDAEKRRIREEVRCRLGVQRDETLLLFCGKLIEKKNPSLLLEALRLLPQEARARYRLIFVGSGPLEEELRSLAQPFAGRVHFEGFVNQSRLPEYYLAGDILVLPSRRAGETWGLVVNEALHAGCGVIVTEAVGCYREFGEWERVRVIAENDAAGCANAMGELSGFQRDFNWCAKAMRRYSVEAAANALATAMDTVEQ